MLSTVLGIVSDKEKNQVPALKNLIIIQGIKKKMLKCVFLPEVSEFREKRDQLLVKDPIMGHVQNI